jgi:Spy/CpxP family protein refolding chaperone
MRVAVGVVAVAVAILAVAAASCSSSGGSGSSDDDALVQRSCEIHFDVAADAADNVDTLSETRARYKDLLDGYGVSLPRQMQQALRDIVSALTTGNANRLEAALADFSSFC